ncbi:MAG: phosphatidylinositol-3-phosphatase [Actinomycetota bacterium]|jgi:acid phosphatase|nr:phosphatidylinositol-3-phosphatase [Actinomycetota bacterium]
MENHSYGEVIGSSSAPYTNSLGHTYAMANNYFAIGHPSLPNYVALLGGSTFGITDDCTSCHVSNSLSLANQLQAAGISWTDYQEGMPSACFTGPDSAAGQYAKKHNPFVYFDSVVNNPAICSHVVPATQLSGDIASGHLPAFTWITPNLCNDTHDCSVTTGDNYLAGLVPGLLQALGPHGALFLIWDESDGDNSGCCGGKAAGGHVPAILAGEGVRKGASSSVAYDHYSVLRTLEDNWGLAELGSASCTCTQPMKDLLAP